MADKYSDEFAWDKLKSREITNAHFEERKSNENQ